MKTSPLTLPSPPAYRGREYVIVLAAVLLAFAPALTHEFAPLDDQGTIWANPRLNPPRFDGQGVLWYWRHAELSLYIPVTYTIWGLLAKATWVPTANEQGIHVDVRVFHGASVLVHALSALAVYALLRRLLDREKGRPQATWPAAAGALLFGLHPLQVEAVAWASGLKDLLAGCLSITALGLYIRAVQASRSPWRRWEYWTGIACVLIGMLCKPAAMVTPLIAVVIDRMLLRRRWHDVTATACPWFLAVAPLMLVAKAVQPPGQVLRPLAWGERAQVAGASLAFYLGKLVLPVKLTLDYGWRPQWMLQRAWFRWLWVVPAALGATLWLCRKRCTWLAASALVSVAALLPVLGFVPFQFQFYSTVSDHYVYLAMLAPAMVLAWMIQRLLVARPAWRVGLAAACTVILLALAAVTVRQLANWKTGESLLRRELALVPDSLLGHNGMGFIESDPRHNNPEAAEREFAEAVRIDPSYVAARDNLRSVYFDLGRPAEAIAQVEAMIADNPRQPPEFQADRSQGLLKMGVDAALKHRFADAVQYVQAYLRYHPRDADARALLEKVTAAAKKVGATTRSG